MAYTRRNVTDGVTVMNKDLYDNLQDGIDENKKELSKMGGTIEVGDEPTKENTVLIVDPNGDEVVIYTAEEVDEMFENVSNRIVNCLPKNQGASNVGKILVVGTDGNLVLIDIPEGGTSGDVTDASVTAENIKSALGYTPANAEKLDRIFEDVLTEVETVLSSGTNKTLTLGIDYKAGDTLKFECLTDNTGVAEISYEIYMEPSEPDEDDDLIEESGMGFVTIAPMTGSEKSYTKMTVNSTMLSFSVNGYVTAYRIDYKNASGSETGDDGTDNSAVKYEPQELTDDQKAQARTNIGAASAEEVSQLSQEIANYQYELTDEEKQEIVDTVKAEVPLVKVAEQPTFANSVDEMTDTSKVYLMSDGYLYAYMETTGVIIPRTLTADDLECGNLDSNGITLGSGTDRIYTKEVLSLENNVVSITRPSGYRFLIYFYNTATPTAIIGKTTWLTASVDDITKVTLSTGTLSGATHFRVSMCRMTTESDTNLSDNVEEFATNIVIKLTPTTSSSTTDWVSTRLSYNQPVEYEDRLVALENALEVIEYGSY